MFLTFDSLASAHHPALSWAFTQDGGIQPSTEQEQRALFHAHLGVPEIRMLIQNHSHPALFCIFWHGLSTMLAEGKIQCPVFSLPASC